MKNELIRLRSIYEEKNNSALRGLDFKIYKGEGGGSRRKIPFRKNTAFGNP